MSISQNIFLHHWLKQNKLVFDFGKQFKHKPIFKVHLKAPLLAPGTNTLAYFGGELVTKKEQVLQDWQLLGRVAE